MAGQPDDPPIWRGAEIHGFSAPSVLEYSHSTAGSRFTLGSEACAFLMNGRRYESKGVLDNEDYKDYEIRIVSNGELQSMAVMNGANLEG